PPRPQLQRDKPGTSQNRSRGAAWVEASVTDPGASKAKDEPNTLPLRGRGEKEGPETMCRHKESDGRVSSLHRSLDGLRSKERMRFPTWRVRAQPARRFPMAMVVRCPNKACGKPCRIDKEHFGRTVQCPHCRRTLAIPRPQ